MASQPGWSLVRSFVDQASGATLERPALAQALAEARARRYDLLLVYRVDRLARSVRGLAQVLEDLEGAGTAFRSATEPFDTTTPAGRMMVQLLAVVAEFERAVIIDRVIAGMERKAARGEWVAGARPFGYRIHDSRLVPDETEAALVGVIFDLYAWRRLGAHAIAARLNQAGHRARSGKAWGHTAVLTVLRNRAYIGEIYFRGTWHAAPHDPLIDTEVLRQVQVVLTERGEDYSRRAANVSDYLLSGLVTCAKRGKHFTGTAATGRSATYRYYTCFSRQRYGTGTCDADRLPADELGAAVLAALHHTYRNSRVIQRAVRAAHKYADAGRARQEAELAALDAEIAKVDATIERYLQAFEDRTMPEARAGDRVRQLSQRLNDLRVARDRIATALASAPLQAPTEKQLAELRCRIAEAIDAGPNPERKVLLQSLVHEIRVTSRDHIEPFFRVPEPFDATPVRAVYGSVRSSQLSSSCPFGCH